jgi:uncharacterized protein (DUF924 family)
VAGGHDQHLTPKQRAFAYMPYMHSESLAIIERFDRYTHRNTILRRSSTEAELAFLTSPGSSF